MNNNKDKLAVTCCQEGAQDCKQGPKQHGKKEKEMSVTGFSWQRGIINTPAGPAARIATVLSLRDKLGGCKVRWNLGRMNYIIPPGLYAVGEPDHNSPVLVSGNYKLSFDTLRRELSGLHLWLMIIDTRGINVWCAAGKGTFSTEEVVQRIVKVRLKDIVSHREIILPQLAGPGVAAHEVLKQSGFKVLYGPVQARHIPAFLQMECRATPRMRQVTFSLLERLRVVPIELVVLLKPVLVILTALFLFNALTLHLAGIVLAPTVLFRHTMANFFPYFGAILMGTIMVPVLLPYIPGRAFSWKGYLMGVLWTLVFILFIASGTGSIKAAAYFLILPVITAFLSLNFTGASTYTSLSGVIKEMNIALPAMAVSISLGIVGLIVSSFV